MLYFKYIFDKLIYNSRFDNLNPIFYTLITDQSQQTGFIAHEIQEHYPFLVNGEKDGEEFQSVNYVGLIGILVKEIKDLKKHNKNMQKELDTIKKYLNIDYELYK